MVSGWVSMDTGEILGMIREATPTVSAEWVDDLPEMPEGDPELPNNYLKALTEIEAEIEKLNAIQAKLKKQHQKRVRQEKAKVASLKWRYLAEVQAQVAIDVRAQRGKKKSVSYTYGNAGTEMRSRVEVTNEKAARYYCIANVPEAIKREVKFLKSKIPDGVEVPGVIRVRDDVFFARTA